ncbi:hypothetical protein [Cnuella takakiae]|uniref:hypothetical protein n=1 Tax=Cnuella takakiae TaxID=1302690 RepID=UPI0011602579|nr:hypothetical protein [Cnuella takakiae]
MLPLFPLAYKNVLHGHSHFAFGGWVMPILLALILKSFPQLATQVAYPHWRNISVLLLASAYGMVLAFPLQGYAPMAIFFATLSIVAGYYLAWVVWRAVRQLPPGTGLRFVSAGLFYLTLASIGPFITGPLTAMGLQYTPFYYNAIYGYLHFTYNGWFTFAVLGLLYQYLESNGGSKYGVLVYPLMHAACVPTYLLSVLWNKPAPVFYVIGGLGALLQVAATGLLLADVLPLQWAARKGRWLLVLSLLAFVLKQVLQLASAFPTVAEMAAANRSFVISYLHLVLLGFVSLFMLWAMQRKGLLRLEKESRKGLYVFLVGFTTTELLLVAAGFHFIVPCFVAALLFAAALMLGGLLWMTGPLLQVLAWAGTPLHRVFVRYIAAPGQIRT